MPFLKSGNAEATGIHEDYQRHNNQITFVQAARIFLSKQERPNGKPSESSVFSSTTPPKGALPVETSPCESKEQQQQRSETPDNRRISQETSTLSSPSMNFNTIQQSNGIPAASSLPSRLYEPMLQPSTESTPSREVQTITMKPPPPHFVANKTEEGSLSTLISPTVTNTSNNMGGPIIDPVTSMFGRGFTEPPVSMDPSPYQARLDPPGSTVHHPDAITALAKRTNPINTSYTTQQAHQAPFNVASLERSIDDIWAGGSASGAGGSTAPIESTTPSLPIGLSSIWGASSLATRSPSTTGGHSLPQAGVTTTPQKLAVSTTNDGSNEYGEKKKSQLPREANAMGHSSPWNGGPVLVSAPAQPLPQAPAVIGDKEFHYPIVESSVMTPSRLVADTEPPVSTNAIASKASVAKKEIPAPKRFWTHFDEQPGRISVAGYNGEDPSLVVSLGPREELEAHWSLPIEFLQSRRKDARSIHDAIKGLVLGLFRRGCTENGNQASIISKAVTGDDNRKFNYWDDSKGSINGRVPFYSPRTPGHVVFRLYFEDDATYTLATGPSLRVKVFEKDFEGSVRFILSNFKGKKSNPTSLSSLHSLAAVLETPITCPNESAARATWGCIQEARKVVEACWQEYTKTCTKMNDLESIVEDLKKQVEDIETKSQEMSVDLDYEALLENAETEGEQEALTILREKTRVLLSGKASCERKWRDSQQAFASILRAVVSNPSMSIVLRRDLITKMRIEFELWCPLSEEFAIVGDPGANTILWYEKVRDLPHAITADDFARFAQSRAKMQARTLNFEPNTVTLEDILFPRNRGAPNQRSMDPGAVAVFNSMSAAMGKYYQDLFFNEDVVVRVREAVRERTEQCVEECGAFPKGTRVVIFGSSANGFGSPKSDIDMCLQLPDGEKISGSDISGAEAMAKLAKYLCESGMEEVDTNRLTARIPIIKFQCPNPFPSADEAERVIEVDLSMHNPLAVLNTTYLSSYAVITPVTRVLAAVIKRWAKARDINNPARHTLSSYGYILMLLHFLTYHKRTGNGLVSPVAPVEGNPDCRNKKVAQPTPILPNLHWMDPAWLNTSNGSPYRELTTLPRTFMKHPLTEDKRVNVYYCRPNTHSDIAVLQRLFPGQDLSLAILLASFFRYYAYEFDYKRHVVSLHSTTCRGVVEREVKAEIDGWRNYSAALTIEDPFETFYDVAHVLRGGYYHRIRREFAVAYSKIADAAQRRPNHSIKGDLRALSGSDMIDWICEPITTEREPHPIP